MWVRIPPAYLPHSMAIDFEKLHTVFYSNMTGGMYSWLSEHLGVSTDSLQSLQVGWAPVVQFTKRISYDGWFTFPMRDTAGKVTGLSLRNLTGDKVSYPGSKPGCFYAVNPEHQKGDRGYSAGSHNWTRTMDAGELCPVCGKPDGCLLSSEKPSDPKAVICRVNPSDKKMRFGWLHIRKPEGSLSSASLLEGTGMVASVEGASDVCALRDLGMVGVGRPNNVGGLEILADLIRGRDVLVIGENDKKADGKWPGQDGAIAALQTCKRVTRNVKMVFPPAHIKDARAWKVKFGLTLDELLAYVEKQGTERVDHLVLENDNPLTISEAFLRDSYLLGKGKRYLLRRWQSNWYEYLESDGKYAIRQEPSVIQKFYLWSRDKKFTAEGPKGLPVIKPLVGNLSLWANTAHATTAFTLIDVDQLPAWINDKRGPDPRDLIVFNNGILHVPAFLAGEDGFLLETTPDFFNTTALPIPFDATAKCPSWEYFIDSSLGDDPAKIELLQEWLGYCMTPDTSMQKLMYLRGVTGSGKSRVMQVIEALVGPAQSATTSFASLSSNFGLAPLVGKLTCLIWDARTPNNGDSMRGLEVLLNISGNDSINIDRKFKEQLVGQQLTARITIASNSFLNVPDSAGAMLRRLNIIEFQRSFAKNPDLLLPRKLQEETPGIAIWALHGLRRLRENGAFTVPASSVAAMEDWRRGTNPLASFVDECTEPDPDEWVQRLELWDCWSKWALERRVPKMSKSDFYNGMLATAGHVATETVELGGRPEIGYRGMKIHRDAARRYLGRP